METTSIDFQRWHDAAYSRKSIRKFESPPDEAQLKRIRLLLTALNSADVRLELIEATPSLYSGITAVRFKNVTHAVAVITTPDAPLTRAGFKGEALALECTAMGLGTCWEASAHNKKEARRLCGLKDGEVLQAMIAIGVPPSPTAPIPDSSRKRKPLERLVVTQKGASLGDMESWQNVALKCARVAPSALNLQPWRFAFAPGHLCMVASGLFNAGVQLDLGIAMLHIELGAATKGVRGVWTRDTPPKPEETKKKKDSEQNDAVWVFVRLPDIKTDEE